MVKIDEAIARFLELVQKVACAPETALWMPRRRRTPFRLKGSMRLVGTAADLERDLLTLRQEQNRLAIAKFRDL
jgi:hypothetical protein